MNPLLLLSRFHPLAVAPFFFFSLRLPTRRGQRILKGADIDVLIFIKMRAPGGLFAS